MNQNKPHYVDINKITLRLPTYKDGDGETYVAISDVRRILAEASAEDVQEVVRCKDCIHRDPEDKKCDGAFCAKNGLFPMDDNDYCSYGENGLG